MTKDFKIHLDKVEDVIWLVLKTGPIEYYDEVEPGINLEFETDNNLMGIEILHASKFLSFTKKLKNTRVKYETSDDILNIWISKRPVDYAEQYGDFIIHFSKSKKPVYIEILNYSGMLKNPNKKLSSKTKEAHPTQSIPHRIK